MLSRREQVSSRVPAQDEVNQKLVMSAVSVLDVPGYVCCIIIVVIILLLYHYYCDKYNRHKYDGHHHYNNHIDISLSQ